MPETPPVTRGVNDTCAARLVLFPDTRCRIRHFRTNSDGTTCSKLGDLQISRMRRRVNRIDGGAARDQSGGARDTGSTGDARSGGASSATRIGEPIGIPAGFGWRQGLSQEQLRLLEAFTRNQQTSAKTEETGTAAGFTFDAEEASQSPAPPTRPGARVDDVAAEIDSDVVDEVQGNPHVDCQKWKSSAVKQVLRATSYDKDAAVKAIIVLISLALVDESVAVDFVKADSVRAFSVEEIKNKLSKSIVDELRLLDKDARKAIKRKTRDNLSSEDINKLVDVVWPPKENEKVTRTVKMRRKEAATEALKCQDAFGGFERQAHTFFAIPEDVEDPDYQATQLADKAFGRALARNESAATDHDLLVRLASLCAEQQERAAKAAATKLLSSPPRAALPSLSSVRRIFNDTPAVPFLNVPRVVVRLGGSRQAAQTPRKPPFCRFWPSILISKRKPIGSSITWRDLCLSMP